MSTEEIRISMSKKEMTLRTVKVTPQMAKTFLERNISANRAITVSKVEQYTKDIVSDGWLLTHQPMAFDGDLETGSLFDGQHRCHAIVKAGKPVSMVVAEHADPSTFHKIDCGKVRGSSDIFTIAYKLKFGEAPTYNTYAVSVACGMLKGLKENNPAREEIAGHALKHAHLITRLVQRLGQKKCNYITTHAIAAFANASLYFGRAKIDPLVDRLATEMWNDINDPLKALSQRLMREKLKDTRHFAERKMSGCDRYAITLAAIRAALSGRPLQRVEITKNDLGELETDRLIRRQPNPEAVEA